MFLCFSNKKKIKDFNYSSISKLLKNIDKNKQNIVLLTTGSFNPIHRMHLEIFNLAYNHLLSLKKYNILCAFISPSSDCYVKKKLPPLIPFKSRCKMIETAINDYNDENKYNELSIYLHPWEGYHNYFIDFPDVIKEIEGKLKEYNKNIKLIYVCGMDHYNHCINLLKSNVIVIDRKPYLSDKYKENEDKLIFFIKDENNEEYSSTSIREAYRKNDLEIIKKITFPNVAKMIIDFYKKNYKVNK